MTLMGICRECVEEKPAGRSPERQNLRRGPDGEKLCSRHASLAWNEHEGEAESDQEETA